METVSVRHLGVLSLLVLAASSVSAAAPSQTGEDALPNVGRVVASDEQLWHVIGEGRLPDEHALSDVSLGQDRQSGLLLIVGNRYLDESRSQSELRALSVLTSIDGLQVIHDDLLIEGPAYHRIVETAEGTVVLAQDANSREPPTNPSDYPRFHLFLFDNGFQKKSEFPLTAPIAYRWDVSTGPNGALHLIYGETFTANDVRLYHRVHSAGEWTLPTYIHDPEGRWVGLVTAKDGKIHLLAGYTGRPFRLYHQEGHGWQMATEVPAPVAGVMAHLLLDENEELLFTGSYSAGRCKDHAGEWLQRPSSGWTPTKVTSHGCDEKGFFLGSVEEYEVALISDGVLMALTYVPHGQDEPRVQFARLSGSSIQMLLTLTSTYAPSVLVQGDLALVARNDWNDGESIRPLVLTMLGPVDGEAAEGGQNPLPPARNMTEGESTAPATEGGQSPAWSGISTAIAIASTILAHRIGRQLRGPEFVAGAGVPSAR